MTAIPVPAVEVRGLSHAYDDGDVLHDIDLDVIEGETLSLLGPSGCGKTTLLRCIAGLERPRAGSIALGRTVVSAPDTFVHPRRRALGMVFQDGALFPHLSVADNIAFGLARNGQGHADRVEELLALVGLSSMGERRPGTLSGGQAQRVALARALAPSPSVLLLDEPFSSLDASLRSQVRSEVQRILGEVGVTAVFVTHDQEEAFELGDRVAVLRDGRLEQVDDARQLYRSPASQWVATFVGEANVLEATGVEGAASSVLGRLPLETPLDGPLDVVVRPEDVLVVDAGAGVVDASVLAVRYRGHDTLVDLDAAGVEIVARLQGDPTDARTVGLRYVGPPVPGWPRDR